jgi:hypothetical protein
MDRTNGRLDAAVLAYRANPTDENHVALMAAGMDHMSAFFKEQAEEFQTRTHGEAL